MFPIPRNSHCRWISVVATLLFACNASGSDKVDFTRDVRPILSRYCFKCHGPDDKVNKGGLRLDSSGGAVEGGASGKPAIVAGKADESELVRRIFSDKPRTRMPPASTKLTLTDGQKQILKHWIAEGGEYRQHWAFVRPKQVPLPAVKHKAWPKNPIDYFVLDRLEKAGLAPSPAAEPHTLVRRLYLDLIGLPPTPEEVDRFVTEWSATPQAAVEKMVDRLLASPHYGERWARRWLDLARYADTNGYEQDRPRSIWPYRDWVIEALNKDMPFDQFTVEQIAGDMLPGATLSQRVATGFHRNSMLNEEGGIDPLEFRYHAMVDRANTTATAWLGLTLGCAQCHTHKYDPITQREYYQLLAFLNNADEPDLDLPKRELDEQYRQNLKRAGQLLAELPRKFPIKAASDQERTKLLEQRFIDWLKHERSRVVKWLPLRPVAMKANLPLLTLQPDDSIFVSGDITKRDVYDLTFRPDPAAVAREGEAPAEPGKRIGSAGASPSLAIAAIRLDALADERLPRHGPGRVYYGGGGTNGDFFLSEFTLLVNGQKQPFAKASHTFANGKFVAQNAIDGDPQSGWSVNGGQGKDHHAVFVLAKPQAAKEFTIQLLFERYYAADLGRFRISVTSDPKAQAWDLPAEIEGLLHVPDDKLTKAQRQKLFEQFLLDSPELVKEAQEIEKLRKRPEYPTTLVLQERPASHPRPTFVHKRGEFLEPVEKVGPATLSALHPFPNDLPRDRLGFARWLVSGHNPLTARVTVNRQWQAFFGRGIVPTLEDFGIQGQPPTHPELLDWLAIDFMKHGWSLKKLHRLIVTSATYQQNSRATSEMQRDPDNKLLARFPRTRLEAELIRDFALGVSGLLSPKIGGPSVYPPQPAGVTEVAFGMTKWEPSKGTDRYRRGLYTFTKRTAPYAMFTTFDGPSGEICVARRDVSNTPLQALTLLNDEVFVEAAQALGKKIVARAGSVEKKAEYLFRRVLSRRPDQKERAMLVSFFETQRQRFDRTELDATKVAGPGDGNVNERAAWTALARALLNTDEAITR